MLRWTDWRCTVVALKDTRAVASKMMHAFVDSGLGSWTERPGRIR